MSSPLDSDYTEQETRNAWSSDGTPADASFSDVDAQGSSELATLPNYSMGTPVPQTARANLPDTKLTSQIPGPNLTDDQVQTQMDSAATQLSLNQTAGSGLPSLQHAAEAAPDRVSQAATQPALRPAGPPANPFGPPANPWQPQPPADHDTEQVNTWTDVSSPGYLSAQLVHADYSLLAAVAAAGTAAGSQAALVAQTVTIDPADNTVTAGGSQPVGSRNTPAGLLAGPSERNPPQYPQFRVGPWFFPAVASWASANPPPPPEADPQQPEQPSGSAQGMIEPGSQFAAEGYRGGPSDDLAGGIQDDIDSITEHVADDMIK